eukprot:624857-Pelagomonas_calceolata.AAC.1
MLEGSHQQRDRRCNCKWSLTCKLGCLHPREQCQGLHCTVHETPAIVVRSFLGTTSIVQTVPAALGLAAAAAFPPAAAPAAGQAVHTHWLYPILGGVPQPSQSLPRQGRPATQLRGQELLEHHGGQACTLMDKVRSAVLPQRLISTSRARVPSHEVNRERHIQRVC